jgi:hypothetical protein
MEPCLFTPFDDDRGFAGEADVMARQDLRTCGLACWVEVGHRVCDSGDGKGPASLSCGIHCGGRVGCIVEREIMEQREARTEVSGYDWKVDAEDRVCECVASLRRKQGVVSEIRWWPWGDATWI